MSGIPSPLKSPFAIENMPVKPTSLPAMELSGEAAKLAGLSCATAVPTDNAQINARPQNRSEYFPFALIFIRAETVNFYLNRVVSTARTCIRPKKSKKPNLTPAVLLSRRFSAFLAQRGAHLFR